jgi:signal transduction histidine kinase
MPAREITMDIAQNKISPLQRNKRLSPMSPLLPSRGQTLGIDNREPLKPFQTKFPVIARTSREAGFMLYEILGMAELIRVAYEKGEMESMRTRLALLMAESANLSTALNNILELSALVTDLSATVYQSFDIVALLQEISQAGRQDIRQKSVEIIDVLSTGPVMILSSQEIVRKIMTGLMSNAVKFTDRGRIALILDKDDYRIRLIITDTGRGMTAEQMNAAFAPSALRWHPEGNSHTKSGLRIIRNLVKLLDGDITVSSKVGEGTIVEISLPIGPLGNSMDSYRCRCEEQPRPSYGLRG